MNTDTPRTLRGFFMDEKTGERGAPNPAYPCDGPWEKQRNPDTYEIADGCYRRLPCTGSDDADYT